jgi:hypothetical protein
MCRNISALRGLEPPATAEEIEAAARQYLRKVGGIAKVSGATEAAFGKALADVAGATAIFLEELPARRRPPKIAPPLRRSAASRS